MGCLASADIAAIHRRGRLRQLQRRGRHVGVLQIAQLRLRLHLELLRQGNRGRDTVLRLAIKPELLVQVCVGRVDTIDGLGDGCAISALQRVLQVLQRRKDILRREIVAGIPVIK